MIYLILILIGLLGGTLAGLLGVGGGVIFTPVLFFLFDGRVDDPVSWTIGTSLLCTFAASTGSTRKHFRMENFYLKESLLVGGFGLIGTYIGKTITLSPLYTETEFTILFSSILLFTAYKFFTSDREKSKTPENLKNESDTKIKMHQAALIGISAGILAALAGVGGGVIMVPAMTMLLGLSFMKTISVSSAAIFLISLFGWIQFTIATPLGESLSGYTLGYVDFGTALPLIAGALAGSTAGVWLTGKIQRRTLELIFAALTLIISVRLIWGLF